MSLTELIPKQIKNKKTDKILKAFTTTKRLSLLRAPAGSGKTTIALAYLVSSAVRGLRGGIFFRTRMEMEHALAILHSMLKNKNFGLLITPTPSKDIFCVMHPPKEIIKYWCPISECDRIRRRKYSDIEKLLRNEIYTSIQHYVRVMATDMRCPYYIAQELLGKADIVIGTHQYLVRKDLYQKIGKLDIVVIDEAHNLVITKTFEELKKEVEEGEKIFEEASSMEKAISNYIVRLWRENRRDEAKKLAVYDVYINSDGYDVEVGNRIIRVLPPINLIKRLLQESQKIIVMSSTLYPSKFFELLFSMGIDHETTIVEGLLNTQKREIHIPKTNLTTAYRERNIATLKKYAETIRKIARKTNQKIVVFCPNHETAKTIAKLLNTEPEKTGEKILVTVYRGKISEGVELPNYNTAIMVGLPFPKTTKETQKILELYSKIYRTTERSMREAYTLSSMYSALIQAIGRIGRKEKGKIYIVDRRTKKYIKTKQKQQRDPTAISQRHHNREHQA